ncbi:MAG: LLM class flavin-dependent oxidoreductase, partial [Leptospirales bacterium]
MIPYSILDLSPIIQGGDAAQSFRNTLDLARHAERLGFNRFWLAEHHGMPGIASAATSVVISHVAQGTKTIRVGAGGIMLPNHSPLVIAEQFGTLETLYPGRIDLGLGRAPGSDQKTAQALRRTLTSSPDDFPRDVYELMNYFQPPPDYRGIRAVPGAGLDIPIWILGSSLFGAQLAAALGLPYAFASHFAPGQLIPAMRIYRERFEASANRERPYFMPALNVVAADTDEKAMLLASSAQQAFVNLVTRGPMPLPPPVPDYAQTLSPTEE